MFSFLKRKKSSIRGSSQTTSPSFSSNPVNPSSSDVSPSCDFKSLPSTQPPPSYLESTVPQRTEETKLAPASDTMWEYLREYDTIIIVDDSASMKMGDRWQAARLALRNFAKKAVQYDEDGIEIRFLNNKIVGRHIVSDNQVMKLFDTVVPTGGTPIGRVLDQCITKYMSSWMRNFAPQEDIKEWNEFLDRRAGKRASYTNYQHKAKASKTTLEQEEDDSSVPKPVNYLVITDGEPTDRPEDVIIRLAKQMDKFDLPLQQIGIQFVQVGDDPNATRYLQELDDTLHESGHSRDIVDTEPYNRHEPLTEERLIKILIGGINRRIDRRDGRAMPPRRRG